MQASVYLSFRSLKLTLEMATKKPKIAIGIDLGTTNSCVTAWKNGKLEVIPNSKTGDYLTPSWVVYKPQEAAVGNTAKYSSSIRKDVKTTLFDIKRIIGRKYYDPITQKVIKNWPFNVVNHSGTPRIELEFKSEKKYVYPEEVSALILTEMKAIAQTYLDEENITDAVITVPAYFNDHQRQATKDAAKIAGLNVIRLINEPTAAAISYIFDKPEKDGRNILIYDLGGGTFDVSIITLKGSNIKVKATLGDTNLGGANFDLNCTDYFIGLVEKEHHLNIELDDKSLLRRRLQNIIEQRKHDLASTSSCTITIDYFYKDISLDEELSRARFNSMNNDLFERTIEIVKQCVAEAKLKKEEIDDIVLVGGSTRIVAIQEKLEAYFGKKLKQDINADQAVARGAGILAASLSGALEIPLIVCDVLPMSLGIETLDSTMNVIIKRNTQIPTTAKRSYTTGQKGQPGVRITIFMGDNNIARNNTELGTFSLVDLPESPSIEIIFQLDINGILTVDAEETSSGIRKTINLTLNKGRLTEQNVQELKRRSNLIVMQSIKSERINFEKSMLESYLLKLKGDIKRGEIKFNRQKRDVLIKMVEDTLIWIRTNEACDVSALSNKFAEVKLLEKQ